MSCAGNVTSADIIISIILRHGMSSYGRIGVVVQVPQGVGVEGGGRLAQENESIDLRGRVHVYVLVCAEGF